MADIFKSKYTGEKIEALLDKADGIAIQTGATDDEFEGITIEGKTYHLPQPQDTQDVVANPTDEATEDLTKLKVGNTTYSIPQNGSSVVANPSAQGTANLERLEVDGRVYDLPQAVEVQANPQGGGDIDLNSIRIGGVNYNIVEPETIAANPLQEATVILSKLQIGSTVYAILPAGAPIEISTEAAMDAVLEGAQIGAVFKYIGETTSKYENGALYLVEEGA